MADRIAYRGPDDAGTWVDAISGIALAHRRLSILDLSPEGHQPMASADGRYVISFNGEIYNYRDLRGELEPRGHHFRGHSDTEVLLAAFTEWGILETLRRSNGMFAVAVWDRAERQLHLCRDRFGEKPLFYGWSGGIFLFGSELKALRGHPRFRATVDPGALDLFLRYGYVPAPHCIYDGLSKVLPGTVVSFTAPSHIETITYWSPREVMLGARATPFLGDEREAMSELHQLLLESVRLRLVSDVPLGAFLSGGIDSSLVVALMQAQSQRPIKTFTIGFEREDYNEAPRARAVATHLGTDHTELYMSGSETLSVVQRIPEMYDEPFSDSSQIPTFLVAQMARRSVTVGLSGDGGDELFGGYTRYLLGDMIWNTLRRIPYPARRALARAIDASPGFAWVAIEQALRVVMGLRPRSAADALHAVTGFLRARDPAALYHQLLISQDGPPVQGGARSTRDGGYGPPSGLSFVECMMYWDTLHYLPDDILTKVDRATMSVGLEARVPLLDPHLFEFAWRLPLAMKFKEGVTKRPLRAILDTYVPRALTERPKRGFAVPLAEWLRGPLRSWMQDLLAPGRLNAQGLLDPQRYATAMSEHLTGVRDRRAELWNALVFQAWANTYDSAGRQAFLTSEQQALPLGVGAPKAAGKWEPVPGVAGSEG
jgi:asparagine synthase (glutamine-hydrolysing)